VYNYEKIAFLYRIVNAQSQDTGVYYCVAESTYEESQPSRNITIDVVYMQGRCITLITVLLLFIVTASLSIRSCLLSKVINLNRTQSCTH